MTGRLMPKARTLREAFGTRHVENEHGCWLWVGPQSLGYGYVGYGGRGKRMRAHRASLILSGVNVPDDAVVMHICDVPLCVNPAHLRVGTQSENNLDMRAKARNRPRQMLTECRRGHPFNPENTIYYGDGQRRCRACHNARSLAAYHRRKSKGEE
jgi:hypothetical protein